MGSEQKLGQFEETLYQGQALAVEGYLSLMFLEVMGPLQVLETLLAYEEVLILVG